MPKKLFRKRIPDCTSDNPPFGDAEKGLPVISLEKKRVITGFKGYYQVFPETIDELNTAYDRFARKVLRGKAKLSDLSPRFSRIGSFIYDGEIDTTEDGYQWCWAAYYGDPFMEERATTGRIAILFPYFNDVERKFGTPLDRSINTYAVGNPMLDFKDKIVEKVALEIRKIA